MVFGVILIRFQNIILHKYAMTYVPLWHISLRRLTSGGLLVQVPSLQFFHFVFIFFWGLEIGWPLIRRPLIRQPLIWQAVNRSVDNRILSVPTMSFTVTLPTQRAMI